jgi:alpha-1,2-mannosyltransferase
MDGKAPGKRASRFILPLVLAVLFIGYWLGSTTKPGGDFHVFWTAGRLFHQGLPLYQPVEGMRPFIYPPFAAMVFQILGLFPIRVAAGLFTLLNLCTLFFSARTSLAIIRSTEPSGRPGPWPLTLALLLSLQFVLSNLRLGQMNLVVFWLCVAFIDACLRGRPTRATIFLAAAIGLKLTPAVFIPWLLIRGRGDRSVVRTTAWLILALALTAALPAIWRGPTRGFADLGAYLNTFLRPQLAGMGPSSVTNHSLEGLVRRSALGTTAPVMAALRILLSGAYLAALGLWAHRKQAVSSLEISSGFLLWHLVSPITWIAHMVSMVFVYLSFLARDLKGAPAVSRALHAASCAGIVAAGLSGRDLIGRRAFEVVSGWELHTWVLLLLFASALALARSGRQAPFPLNFDTRTAKHRGGD